MIEDEFAQLEGQLSKIERYAMRLLELESFDKVEQQLREAEVSVLESEFF